MWLRSQVFSHGQLYVGISRVGNPDNLRFAVMLDEDKNPEPVKNVVYREVLLRDQ